MNGVGGPLAAPSANRFERISPTKVEHARRNNRKEHPSIVDGGQYDARSRVHHCRGASRRDRYLPASRTNHDGGNEETGRSKSRRNGSGRRRRVKRASRYAPRTRLVLAANTDSFEPLPGRLGCLSFYQEKPATSFAERRVLSPSGDLREAAANLFRYLRELDEAQLDLIVAEELPEDGLGCAIMDRLRRAAAHE